MSFKERIEKKVQKGQERVMAAREADAELRARWSTKLQVQLRCQFSEAAVAMQRHWDVEAESREEGEQSVFVLGVEQDGGRQELRLEFCPFFDSKWIVCRAAEPLTVRFGEKTLSLDEVAKESLVEDQIAAFVDAVFDYLAELPELPGSSTTPVEARSESLPIP